MSDIRLLLTNDFFGSFARQPTSWGTLPGGAALRRRIDTLREDAGTAVWLDAGDVAGGGPLAPVSDGELSWAGALELGIDLAVPGNHEFDFGDTPVLTWAARSNLPLVAADEELQQLSPLFHERWMITAPSGRTLAVVGINLAERRGRTVWDRAGDLDAGAKRALAVIAELPDDVDHVVVVVHDGVPESSGQGSFDAGPRMSGFCAALRGTVDAVVGGHTLMRHIGEIAGVPYIQPWALGVEVGVLDIDELGVHLDAVGVAPPPEGELGWRGTGSRTIAELASRVIANIHRPLTDPATPQSEALGAAVTHGLLAITDADVALTTTIEVGCGQLPIDGIKTYLPAGPITEADVYRALPWPGGTRGDEMWAAELTTDEVAMLSRGLDIAIPTGVSCHRALRKEDHASGVTLVSSNYVRNARRMLKRDVEWWPAGVGLRDGLRAYLGTGAAAARTAS
ncbi:metallophosphoesterase [Candidatus Protofrankia californiensis]|uniref:metallophosphoesterase n=1 Tax=Candidatus Protofrankia californiensis TaxID=1839754 RepID=UPI001041389E|nr:metallophosphoesterase [Candidatus Protofrankia californiensis]